jgi:hypothetical protein
VSPILPTVVACCVTPLHVLTAGTGPATDGDATNCTPTLQVLQVQAQMELGGLLLRPRSQYFASLVTVEIEAAACEAGSHAPSPQRKKPRSAKPTATPSLAAGDTGALPK